MSRCFPYPPPYYGESLIESIKLQKEKAKAKEEKEKRREKKEKREKANQKPVNSQHKEKRQYEEKSLVDQKDQYSQKTSNDVIEQLERSSLTEEHELPCSIRYKHDSPESSQDSNKRRKLVPSASSHSKHGTILRIKLPSLRQRDLEPPLPSSSQVGSKLLLPLLKQKCSEPSSTQTVGQAAVVALAKGKQIVNEQPAAEEQPCSSGRDVETALDQEAAVPSHRTSSTKRIGGRTWQKEQFGDLIVNWNPPPSQFESPDIGDEEWLFGASKRHSSSYAECKASAEGLSVCSPQPRAFYMPEFDMYQLPYVVPF